MSLDIILMEITSELQQHPDTSHIRHLQALVATIRPRHARDIAHATDNIRALCFVLQQHPAWRRALLQYLVQVLTSRKLLHLLTDTGITLNNGFWGAATHRLLSKCLPPLVNDDYVKDIFGQIFNEADDHIWINGISDHVWMDLLANIGLRTITVRQTHHTLSNEVLSAVQVLSYRITTIGLEAELVRNYPDIEKFESPFLRQNDEINDYILRYRAWLNDRQIKRDDSLHIDVLLSQCDEIVSKIRKTAAANGVSVSLTRLLLRLTQSMFRLRKLLALLDAGQRDRINRTSVQLFKELVTAENRRHSLRDLIQTNTELLSLQVTERAGKSGEHYVTGNRSEWLGMFRSAMGAGFLVGFMAMIKVLMSKMALAPFGYAVLYSLNYSSGFMLVHVLHFTIATKQPAMTAALIARAIDQGKQKLDELADLIVAVFRSQLIAIIGNIALALPTAYAIAWAWYGITGSHLAPPEKAQHLLHDLDPFGSLALPHAAIAGVCLFVSGLISGYYDNKASYAHIPARLRQLPWLRKCLGEARLHAVTHYIGNNLGALAGNFFFGIMLGTIGQLGVFFGLPVDIRHITFSSANFAFALVGLEHQISWQLALYSLSGILLIGLVNLGVSFSLALLVALRSRRVSFGQGGTLLSLLWQRFRSDSRAFFLPLPDAVSHQQTDGENNPSSDTRH
ncbi:site-specific recombinase [Undibacterium oligocarboniphilum]|uniref:Site-specific recombinase n=1 Tax=Undibacterium oligocarboniphilum TaxID=666702 RepID=A0A850QIR8_9BURK|nr:site-specific recombinase [Undibacterium oligocarboniphilum]MBC3871643.1 site-specific recombinase [Undibacterium oligocarboniphilum]NVO79168.1 site-specific recombinase [Undibacterium oligocarboniphilum]